MISIHIFFPEWTTEIGNFVKNKEENWKVECVCVYILQHWVLIEHFVELFLKGNTYIAAN